MHVTRILNSTAHGPELRHSEEWEQWNVLSISKMWLVTEKRQIRCNDPGARTLVTVRKMKPAAVSQAFQITEAQPWQHNTNISDLTAPNSCTLHSGTSVKQVYHLQPRLMDFRAHPRNRLQVLLAPLSPLQKHEPDATRSFIHPCFQPARLFNRNMTSAIQKLSNYVRTEVIWKISTTSSLRENKKKRNRCKLPKEVMLLHTKLRSWLFSFS